MKLVILIFVIAHLAFSSQTDDSSDMIFGLQRVIVPQKGSHFSFVTGNLTSGQWTSIGRTLFVRNSYNLAGLLLPSAYNLANHTYITVGHSDQISPAVPTNYFFYNTRDKSSWVLSVNDSYPGPTSFAISQSTSFIYQIGRFGYNYTISEINPTTGEKRVITTYISDSYPYVISSAFSDDRQQLMWINGDWDHLNGILYTVNVKTGAMEQVALQNCSHMMTIEWNAKEGKLYGIGRAGAYYGRVMVYSVNLSTRSCSTVMVSSTGGVNSPVSSSSMNPYNKKIVQFLYANDGYILLDVETQQSTYVGSTWVEPYATQWIV